MPAKSKAQQRFFGMVRAAQKGEGAASPEVAKVADEISDKDAKKFAKTKHKGLPEKKKVDEGVMDVVRRYGKKKEERKPQKAMDAGARAKRKLARREYEKKVSPFVPDELKDHKTWNDFKKHI